MIENKFDVNRKSRVKIKGTQLNFNKKHDNVKYFPSQIVSKYDELIKNNSN